MTRYLTKVRDTLRQLGEWTIEKVPRPNNVRADALAGIASSFPIKKAILLPIYVQANLSITKTPACNAIEESQKWMSIIKEYLRTCALPEESKQEHKIRVQATHFALIGECLYKRSFTSPYLRCPDHSEARYMLAELHEGICSNHPG